jgi:hypothetical protein
VRAVKSIVPSLLLLLGSIPAPGLVPAGWQKQAPPANKSRPGPPTGGSGFGNGQAPPGTASFSASGQSSTQNSGAGSPFHLNGPGPHKGDWLRKYFSLPANQQEQQLQQDPAFRTLTPDKQQHLLDRLRKFNSEPPQKKQQIFNRM